MLVLTLLIGPKRGAALAADRWSGVAARRVRQAGAHVVVVAGLLARSPSLGNLAPGALLTELVVILLWRSPTSVWR